LSANLARLQQCYLERLGMQEGLAFSLYKHGLVKGFEGQIAFLIFVVLEGLSNPL
jgi:hypothetical protein